MRRNPSMRKKNMTLNRRAFLQLGAGSVAAWRAPWPRGDEAPSAAALAKVFAQLEYLTRDEDFINYGRGHPPPWQLPKEKKRAVGLTPESWYLEVRPDPASNAQVEHPLTRQRGTALDWAGLMRLAERHAVRFLGVMSCTNGRRPCGMGLWEGVPLREVIWRARPVANVRRVTYYGYHNDDPAQRFQSSLPIGRVLEDPPGELPVILCYKLNGRWLTSKRGGPVRMLVPGYYGNKSVKWLQQVLLTNDPEAHETYAKWNNDTESHLKTCARFLQAPKRVPAGERAVIVGVAQVGMSGLKRVQYAVTPASVSPAPDDPYGARLPWRDAVLAPPPRRWGGGLPDDRLPPVPAQVDPATGRPRAWPLRDTIVHWAALLPELPAGHYLLCCRTIDARGVAQPMPRPFPKSGNNKIETRELEVV